MHGYTENKDDYLKRLRRIEGQIRGLPRPERFSQNGLATGPAETTAAEDETAGSPAQLA